MSDSVWVVLEDQGHEGCQLLAVFKTRTAMLQSIDKRFSHVKIDYLKDGKPYQVMVKDSVGNTLFLVLERYKFGEWET